MADSYIINVKPTISNSDGRKMENDLNKRFARVASKFGGALRTVGSKLKGMIAGGVVAGIGAIMANPIDNLNQSIDETLRKYDDISSRAKQLGVSSGQLYQATAIAKSAGIEEDDFRSILTAYAVKLGEARKGDDLMLAEFAGEKNIISGFFQFLKSLQELEPSERMYYASKIIGEDDSAKLAELINTDVIQRQRELFGSVTPEQSTKEIEYITKPEKTEKEEKKDDNYKDNQQKIIVKTEEKEEPQKIVVKTEKETASDRITRAIERLSAVEGQQQILKGRREVDDLLQKSAKITTETIRLQNDLIKKQLEVQNTQLKSYEAFARMQASVEEGKLILANIQEQMTPLVEKGVGILEKSYNWLQNSKIGKWMGVFK